MHSPRYLTQTLTLAALSAMVLSGCGEKATGSIPEPGDSSSSAASSASVSAGGADTSEGATAEATERFSGGSKAPEGEYRAADEQGLAQNVPKPEAPAGMNVESDEGLEKFIGYWNDSVNYGVQTGDFSYAAPLVAESYTSEHEFYIWANEIYNRGGWIVGARREAVIGEGLLVSQGDGVYTWGGNLNIEDMQVYLDGPGDVVDWSHTRGQGIYYETNFVDGKWVLGSVEVVEQ